MSETTKETKEKSVDNMNETKTASQEFPWNIRPPVQRKEMLYSLMKALEIPTSRFEWVDRWAREGSMAEAEAMIPQVDESGKEEFIRAAAITLASRSYSAWSDAETLWDQRMKKLQDVRFNAVRDKAFEIYDKKYVEELTNMIILTLTIKHKIYTGL